MKESQLLRLSASDLQKLLQKGELTSSQLVKACLDQIERYDRDGPSLRAIVSAPQEDNVLAVAKHLDHERASGKVRGPFHGLPIIVKASPRVKTIR